jgi:hypothetical protein
MNLSSAVTTLINRILYKKDTEEYNMVIRQEYSEKELLGINVALQNRTLTELQRLYDLLNFKYKYPRGTTLTSTIHLQIQQPPTRIDFTDPSRHRNIPVNPDSGGKDNIDTRFCPVSRLIIFNMGPSGIHCDTNRDYNDISTETPINSNSSFEFISDFPSIHSINMVAQDDDAKVRLTAIV